MDVHQVLSRYARSKLAVTVVVMLTALSNLSESIWYYVGMCGVASVYLIMQGLCDFRKAGLK
jgi:hypothetical protein